MPLTQVDQGLLGQYAQYTGFKNRIINPGMVIDQRNAGASVTVTTSTGYTLDRWTTAVDASSKFSVQQVADAPSGFTYSLKATSLSAYTPTASEEFRVGHIVEGYNVADMDFGLATAKTFTLSFWVKSSLTGTFGLYLANATNARTLVSTYTINSANTWEQKTVTVTGDTTGTWLTTNGRGIQVFFELAAGSNYYTATTNTWTSSSGVRTTSGQTQFVATNGATWQVTGVQLEKGSTATSFDYRPYGTELQLCQRYCQVVSGGTIAYASTTSGYAAIAFPTAMRAAPSLPTILGTVYWANMIGTNAGVTGSPTWAFYGTPNSYGANLSMTFNAANASPATAGQVGTSYVLNAAYGFLFSAEL